MKAHDHGTTQQFDQPTWSGEGFEEELPNDLWKRLPRVLQEIALEEIQLGNVPLLILENKERSIVLLSFTKGPLVQRESTDAFRVHMSHRYGNYCYDGTKETYEHLSSGCFLAFEDPNYEETDI